MPDQPSALEKKEINIVLILHLIHKNAVVGPCQLNKPRDWLQRVADEYNEYLSTGSECDKLAGDVRKYFTTKISESHVKQQYMTIQKGKVGNVHPTSIFVEAPELSSKEVIAAIAEENQKIKKGKADAKAAKAAKAEARKEKTEEKRKRNDDPADEDNKPSVPPGPEDASAAQPGGTQSAVDVDEEDKPIDVDETAAAQEAPIQA